MRAIKAIIRFLKLSLTAVAIVAILLGAILGFAAFEKSVTENRESRLAHLDAVLDDYLSVLNAASSNEKPIGTATKAKPVLVCFVGNNNNSFATNRYDKSIDFLTLDLPGDLFSNEFGRGWHDRRALLGARFRWQLQQWRKGVPRNMSSEDLRHRFRPFAGGKPIRRWRAASQY